MYDCHKVTVVMVTSTVNNTYSSCTADDERGSDITRCYCSSCCHGMLHAGGCGWWAWLILHTTLQGAALLGSVDALHSSFPDDPDQEYITQGIHDMITMASLLLLL